MNKQIQLVEEWLADSLSVSQAELEASFIATAPARYAANAADLAAFANIAEPSAKPSAIAAARECVAKYHKEVKGQGQ